MSSVWGEALKLSLFGESHGEAVGFVLDGLPAGQELDFQALNVLLERRARGRKRRESDQPELLSGLKEGKTCGAPLAMLFRNEDARPEDYGALRAVPRPGHADYPAAVKYRGYAELSGGGHFSGRLTLPLCAAGGVCLQLLEHRGIQIAAHLLQVGNIFDKHGLFMPDCGEMADKLRSSELPMLDAEKAEKVKELLADCARRGDSVGGTVECLVRGLPVGLGGPLFGGLEPRLASALFAIPAVKGLDFGEGFAAAGLHGSEMNDGYRVLDGAVTLESNHAGGVLGGMATGAPLVFRLAFKPAPSIALPQHSVSLERMENTELTVTGRHDVCVALRAVPVVETVTALALLDLLLTEEGSRG